MKLRDFIGAHITLEHITVPAFGETIVQRGIIEKVDAFVRFKPYGLEKAIPIFKSRIRKVTLYRDQIEDLMN